MKNYLPFWFSKCQAISGEANTRPDSGVDKITQNLKYKVFPILKEAKVANGINTTRLIEYGS